MEGTEQQASVVMEQLLKKVFNYHKETLKGVTASLIKYKAAYTKLHLLQKKHEKLEAENRELRNVVTPQQTKDASCCEVIRQSLATVISSYKQMLADKDTRISQLEEELSAMKGSAVYCRTKPTCTGENPDSTSCSTPTTSRQRDVRPIPTPVSPADQQLLMDSSSDDSAKLKLNRKRSQRTRYSEDVSPDCKKSRQVSPSTNTGTTTTNGDGHSQNKQGQESKEFRLSNTEVLCESSNTRQDRKCRNEKRKNNKDTLKILAHDTCVPDLNESVVSEGFIMKNKTKRFAECIGNTDAACVEDAGAKKGRAIDSNGEIETAVLIVPETLAIGMDETLGSEDNVTGIDKRTTCIQLGTDLSYVVEGCRKKEESIKYSVKSSNEKEEGKSENSDENNDTIKGEHIALEIPHSFKSILDSPGSETSPEINAPLERCHRDVTIGYDSLVKDSDDELGCNSLPCSQSFLRSKPVKITGNDICEYVGNPRRTRKASKSVKEVDALFETPPDESNNIEAIGISDFITNTKQPLLKKGKNKHVELEEQSEVILRRSPRKHKPVISSVSRIRTHVKTNLSTLSNDTTEKTIETVERDSKENKVIYNTGIESAPDRSMDNSTECALDTENDTIDCYNVMPVKNGNPIPSRTFQVKVKGHKKTNYYKPQNVSPDCEDRNDETMKSPSILYTSDVRTTTKSNKDNSNMQSLHGNGREVVDDDLEIIEWKSLRPRKNKNISKPLSSLASKCSSLRSSQHQVKKPGMDKVNNGLTARSIYQTTLTQGFFGPEIKRKSDDRVENKGAGKELPRLKDNLDSDNTFGNEQNSQFKRPGTAIVRSDKIKVKDQHTNKTDGHHVVDGNALVEVKQQNGNVHDGDDRLNGSIDPSAELSQWCKDAETLPSLSTDVDVADLHRDLLPRTSTLATEESQDIPSSSTSYKFLPRKHTKKDVENIKPSTVNIDCSFDRLPKNKTSNIAHVAVVRKKGERQKLQGHGCKECQEYYKLAGRTDEEIKQHMKQCSRHRAQYVPPDTPPHFWSVGFIDTQEFIESEGSKEDRNEANDENLDIPSYRRRKKLNQYFKSKNEKSLIEDDYT